MNPYIRRIPQPFGKELLRFFQVRKLTAFETVVLYYTKPKSWTGVARKIRIELPTMRKMRMVDVWEGKSGLLPVISS